MANRPPLPRRQRGVVLVISLIVLVALSLAGIALVRSTDTGTIISGNAAYRMGAMQAVDTGVETAFTATTSDTGFQAAPTTAVTSASGQYFPVIQADANADGIPDVTWSAVPAATVNGNDVRWVVERLCSQNIAAAQSELIMQNCAVVPGPPNMSFKAGIIAPNNAIQSVAFRVTVRVTGPKNAIVYSQSTVAR
jgi:Tfp pilus assembly protein PilX